jgi:hypothetical protein
VDEKLCLPSKKLRFRVSEEKCGGEYLNLIKNGIRGWTE